MGFIGNFLAKIAGKVIAKKLDLKEDKQMEDKKKWWQSKTIIQAVVMAIINIYAILEQLAPTLGFTLPGVPGIVITILNAILGGGIVYTRTTATKQIG